MGIGGGGLIGLAGAMFLLLKGRIIGASSILGSIIDGSASQKAIENVVFILGLAGVPWLISLTRPGQTTI